MAPSADLQKPPCQYTAGKLSMYTEQQTEPETDASASPADFNEFCDVNEWGSDAEEEEQIIPRIISASVVKTANPVGLTIINSEMSNSVVISSISTESPFHTDVCEGTTLRCGDEILTINGHRVRDARRAAEMIRAKDEGILTVVASTADCPGERKRGRVRRRMDGTAYHMVRISTFVAEKAESSSCCCSYRGMELEARDETSGLVCIKSIEVSSVFAKSGLKTGDFLLTVDGCIVRTVDDAIRALSGGPGTDSVNRVIALLVYSFWDMRTRVIRDELSGSSPNRWDISVSSENGTNGGKAEKECITLTMSETTVTFDLLFDQDGTCSCPEPLAALKSFPQEQKPDNSKSSLPTETMFSKTEARAALELLFHRHIQQVVDALNYHSWRQTRLITRAMNASPQPSSEFSELMKNQIVTATSTTATNSLSNSSCPSVNTPKTKSLLIFSDLEKATVAPPSVPAVSLYNVKTPPHEKLATSEHVLHSITNRTRVLAPQTQSDLEPFKMQASSTSGNATPPQEQWNEKSITLPNFQQELPTRSQLLIPVPRPKYTPPAKSNNPSDSSSSSDDEKPVPRRTPRRVVSNNKKKIAPVCNQLVMHRKSNPSQPVSSNKKKVAPVSTQLVVHKSSNPSHPVSDSKKKPAPVSTRLVVQKNSNPSSSCPKQTTHNRHVNNRQAPVQSTAIMPGLNIRRGRIQESYKVNAKVEGIGAFGAVRYCTHRHTKEELAVKSIPITTDAKYSALLRNEISILQQVRHKNVIRLVDVMQDEKYIHIVMEKCEGGDLFDKIIKDGATFGEKMVLQIVGSILDAVDYLHERNICHRDLKAEHLMLKTSDNNKASVKIIDFGLACVHRPEDPPLTAFAGSAFTVAPEVIQRQYGKEADLWSVGVITYFLLMHLMPFNANSNDEMFKKIQSGIFAYPKWAKTGISEEAKDFIERLLVVNPKKRMTAKQALSHAWVRKVQNHNKSDTDMSMAVVLYENKKDTTGGKREVPRRAREPEQALVAYNNKIQRQPARVTQNNPDPHEARAPYHEKVKHKSIRRLHVGDSHGDRDNVRLKKESERKLHNKDDGRRHGRRH